MRLRGTDEPIIQIDANEFYHDLPDDALSEVRRRNTAMTLTEECAHYIKLN